MARKRPCTHASRARMREPWPTRSGVCCRVAESSSNAARCSSWDERESTSIASTTSDRSSSSKSCWPRKNRLTPAARKRVNCSDRWRYPRVLSSPAPTSISWNSRRARTAGRHTLRLDVDVRAPWIRRKLKGDCMKKMSIVIGCAAALLVAAGARAEVREADVTGGRVAGAVANGIVLFKGIPFAAPPVGPLRWKAPQPLQPWTGVKQASTFGASCMQDPMFARLFGAPPEISEDCLYLNVWTPAKSAGDALPVMVWIYGGGFVGGQTSVPAYDGTRLAEKGVVLVSVAYRLGAFGFLAHPELSRESGKGSGNYGLQDQIAGLQWVKANIAKFGGDPNRVTIFGESAGGIAVSMLAASPAAKGLFQRPISESGGSFGSAKYSNEGGVNVAPLKVAETKGKTFLEKLGATSIRAAREIDANKLQAAQGPGLSATDAFWPVFDGDVLPGDQHELYQAKRFNDT